MTDPIPYTGPRMRDDALVTRDELTSGKLQAPPGTVPYVVQPGDNLTRIAQSAGHPGLAALYADNPQYAQRNPDLIYPGEVVFVPDPAATPQSQATTAAAQDVVDKRAAADDHAARVTGGDPSVDGSDQKFYSQSVGLAQGEFDAAARAEIEATTDARGANSREDHANAVLAAAERIALRLEAQGYPEQAARTRELGQQRADQINNEV